MNLPKHNNKLHSYFVCSKLLKSQPLRLYYLYLAGFDTIKYMKYYDVLKKKSKKTIIYFSVCELQRKSKERRKDEKKDTFLGFIIKKGNNVTQAAKKN